MSTGEIQAIEAKRQALLGQLRTAEAAVRAGLHAHGFGDMARDEVNQAASAAMVQDIQNRNDQQKQIVALTEQQNAEFEESVSNYTAKFRLLDAPTEFPTP